METYLWTAAIVLLIMVFATLGLWAFFHHQDQIILRRIEKAAERPSTFLVRR